MLSIGTHFWIAGSEQDCNRSTTFHTHTLFEKGICLYACRHASDIEHFTRMVFVGTHVDTRFLT